MEGTDTLVVIMYVYSGVPNHVRTLVCERNKLTNDEIALIKKLHENRNHLECRKIENELRKLKVSHENMCWVKDEMFKDFKSVTFHFNASDWIRDLNKDGFLIHIVMRRCVDIA